METKTREEPIRIVRRTSLIPHLHGIHQDRNGFSEFDLNLIPQSFDPFPPGDPAAQRRRGAAGGCPAQTVFQRAGRIFKRCQKACDHGIAGPDGTDGRACQRQLAIDAAPGRKED